MQTEPIAMPGTDEWHQLRKTGISASEAGAACGLSPYKTPLDIYLEKTGQLEPVEETDAMRLGKALEPVIQSEFEHRTGIKVIISPMGLYRSAENPFMLATPDALLETNELGEWKSITFRRAAELGEEGTDDLPPDWLCQVHQQMYVTGLAVVHVAILLDGRTLRTHEVQRNERLIEGIIKTERELWERIETHEIPEPNWEHPRTPQLIREMYSTIEDGFRVELSAEAAEAHKRQRQAGRLITKLKARQNAEKAKVLAEIGEHYAGVLPGGEKMVRRKRIIANVAEHTKDYIDCREVKYDGGIMHIPIDADELAARYAKADTLLRLAGFGRHEKSEWGSAYYIHHERPMRVRVSDHAPNRKTREWMDKTECVDLRIDRPDLKLKDTISDLLKTGETNDGDSNSKTEAEHATHKAASQVQQSPTTT